MASENVVARVRKGMEVHTADGQKLGKIAYVWVGSDPSSSTARCDEEVCSRIEVHRGLFAPRVLYLPYNVIGQVSGKHVMLNVDANTLNEKDWGRRPQWIPESTAKASGINPDGFGG